MSEGLEVEQDDCLKEIRDTEVIELRLFTICSFAKAAKKQLRVMLEFESLHSLFWTQENRPSVLVSMSNWTSETSYVFVAFKYKPIYFYFLL